MATFYDPFDTLQQFQQALDSTGKRLDDIRKYVDAHRELRHPLYPVPHRDGITGTAATFVLHVSDLMDGRTRLRKLPVTKTAEHGVPGAECEVASA